MSQTTTAASSSRHPSLSFGWLLSQLPSETPSSGDRSQGNEDHSPAQDDKSVEATNTSDSWGDCSSFSASHSPRVNVSALCRNTFLHLESASPLAKVSQSRLIKSFKNFSARLANPVSPSSSGEGRGIRRRRHTLTQVVVNATNLASPAKVEAVLDQHQTTASPLARLTLKHPITFTSCIKDDSFIPSIGKLGVIMRESEYDRKELTALVEGGAQEESTRVDPEHQVKHKNSPPCVLPLRPADHQPPSPMSRLAVTPTPIGGYFNNQGFFLPSELNQANKAQTFTEDSHETECLSPSRSPTRLRPLADLLTEPWGHAERSMAQQISGSQTANSQQSPDAKASLNALLSADKSVLISLTPNHKDSHHFKVCDWAASLPEVQVTVPGPAVQSSVMMEWGSDVKNRGSLSELINVPDYAGLQNLFASAVAQALLSGGVDEKKRSTETAKNGAEDSVPGGHPNCCKPCAFYWSKGCLNGENCRFCHEWHAPKKKKPMKDQKNLMIIAREDGRIAFLRCAIEDALRHQ